MKSFKVELITSLLFPFLVGCGVLIGNPNDQGGESTNAKAEVIVTSDLPASTLNLQGGVILNDGSMLETVFVNIGRIELHTEKEESQEEIEREEAEEAEEAEEEENETEEEAQEEAALDEIEQRYDALIEAATTEEEKEALKAQEDLEEEEIELQIAEREALREAEDEAKEDLEDDSLQWKQSFLYNVVSGVVSPEIPTVEVLDGTYQRIEFKVKPYRDTSGDSAMLNRSALVSGTAQVAGSPVNFSFATSEDIKFSLKGTGSIVVDGATDVNRIIINFSPSSWFEGIDFSGAELDARGEITIDELNNPTLYEAVIKNMKRSTKYGEDEDEDGELGDDEDEGDGEEQVEEEEAGE